MKTCRTCQYWQRESSHVEIQHPSTTVDGRYVRLPVTHDVHRCMSPHRKFQERPARDGMATVEMDFNTHSPTEILTGPDFGCTNHKRWS